MCHISVNPLPYGQSIVKLSRYPLKGLNLLPDSYNMKPVVYILVALMLASLVCPLSLAGDKDKEVDKKKVYYGNADSFDKPAVVVALDVFKKIDEYNDATKKTKDDPEYYILLEKANEKFKKAVKKAAEDGSYDLVGEKGTVKVKGKTVPDITADVIKALED